MSASDTLLNIAYIIAFSGITILVIRYRFPSYYQLGYEILFPSSQQKFTAKIKASQEEKKRLEILNTNLKAEKELKIQYDQLQMDIIKLKSESQHLQSEIADLDKEKPKEVKPNEVTQT